MKSSYSFGKDERLCGKRDIQELFQKGSSFYLYPFRVLWLENSADQSRVLMSVSRRNFKRAVDRNLIKRRMREAYRLNRVADADRPPFNIAFVYTAKEILPSDKIHNSVGKALSRLKINP